MKSLIVAVIIALALAQQQQVYPPPMPDWPNVWQFNFVEEYSYGDEIFYTNGTYSYNYTSGATNNYRANGQFDFLCGTVFPNVSTPCANIVNGTNRYLWFPQEDYCCVCCTAANGCGTLKPDWGLLDSQYLGDFEFNGTWTTGWLTGDGGYYYQTLNNWPYLFYRGDYDTTIFNQSTFSQTFNPNVFNTPSACNGSGLCNGTCAILQNLSANAYTMMF